MLDIDPVLVQRVSGLLARHELKLMLAESMTAGAIASVLSMGEHAGNFLMGSIVCYGDEIKADCLGVEPALIERYGGVSAQVTGALVEGLFQHFPDAQIFVAVTGFAFDAPATSEEDPVGTTYIHLRMGTLDATERYVLEGNPEEVMGQAVTLVLLLLEDKLHQLLE